MLILFLAIMPIVASLGLAVSLVAPWPREVRLWLAIASGGLTAGWLWALIQ